jgi:hypothetical protein
MGRPKGSKNVVLRLNKIWKEGNEVAIFIDSPKYGNLTCVIDSEDYEKVNFTRWQAIKRGNTFHVQSCSDHNIYIHRIIVLTDKLVDHADGNGLNNRKSNLREATKSQNAMNSLRKKYKGVVFAGNGKYYGRIVLNQNQIHLGTFYTAEEAALAYNKAALTYFGEFARLNELPKLDSSLEISNIEML